MTIQRDSEVPDATCNPVIKAKPLGDGDLLPATPATVIKPRAAPAPKRTPLKKVESVYLVQEREFIKSGESIYKIGRTCQNHTARFAQYPKGSALLLQRACLDCRKVESQIKALFKAKYVQDRDIGVEYFSGDATEMIRDINRLVDAEPAREPAPEVVVDKPCPRERQDEPDLIGGERSEAMIGRIGGDSQGSRSEAEAASTQRAAEPALTPQKDATDVYVENWLKSFVLNNLQNTTVELLGTDIHAHFSAWALDNGVVYETTPIKLGMKLTNMNISGLSKGRVSYKGKHKLFDIYKILKHFSDKSRI